MSKERNEVTPEMRAAVKQYRKQIITTALMALLTLGVIAGSTTAWFASNRKVDANKMEMQVEASENLVISKEAADGYGVAVEFSNVRDERTFQPATHEAASASGLKYNTNPADVSFEHGLSGTADLTFEDVLVANDSEYYIDYTVYIASMGKAFANQDLTAKLEITKADGTEWEGDRADYMQAATIDFYVGESSSAVFKGKAALGGTAQTVTLLDDGEIPLTTTPIKVTMRCYFDGALEKTTGLAYVRSSGLTIGDVFALHVTFEAKDHA